MPRHRAPFFVFLLVDTLTLLIPFPASSILGRSPNCAILDRAAPSMRRRLAVSELPGPRRRKKMLQCSGLVRVVSTPGPAPIVLHDSSHRMRSPLGWCSRNHPHGWRELGEKGAVDDVFSGPPFSPSRSSLAITLQAALHRSLQLRACCDPRSACLPMQGVHPFHQTLI